MSKRLPLPAECLTAPWRTSARPLLDRRTRTRVDVSRPYRGVRQATSLDSSDPTVRALAAAAAWPGTPLGGWAAAHLLEVPDTDGKERSGELQPVVLCPGRSGRIASRPGLVLLRSPLAEGDVVAVGGVLVTSPVRTAFDLARTAGDLWAAVEEVDCVFRGRDAWFLEALAAYAAARPRWRGVDQARRAAARARTNTLSRGESWLRMVWTERAGLPPPLLNTPVYDGDDHLLGTPDLLDPLSGLAGEYDGAVHRTAERQRADAVRGELMGGAGLVLVRATAIDRAEPRAMARRLLAGYERAQGLPRGRWRCAGAPAH